MAWEALVGALEAWGPGLEAAWVGWVGWVVGWVRWVVVAALLQALVDPLQAVACQTWTALQTAAASRGLGQVDCLGLGPSLGLVEGWVGA
jgi:hypothetical protein